MWNPRKLNFSFYDFSVIYYNLSKIQRKKIIKEKIKPRYCSKPTIESHFGGYLIGFEKFRG